jgi:hypothetical protein
LSLLALVVDYLVISSGICEATHCKAAAESSSSSSSTGDSSSSWSSDIVAVAVVVVAVQAAAAAAVQIAHHQAAVLVVRSAASNARNDDAKLVSDAVVSTAMRAMKRNAVAVPLVATHTRLCGIKLIYELTLQRNEVTMMTNIPLDGANPVAHVDMINNVC